MNNSWSAMTAIRAIRKWRTSLETKRIKRLSREGTWIVLGKIALVLGSLALVRVLTEFLTPPEYGQLALGLTVVTLFQQVVFGGVGAGVGRYYAIAAEKRDLHGYLGGVRTLLFYATVVSLGLGLGAVAAMALSGYSQWISLALAATGLAIFSGYNGIVDGIQNAARQRAVVALHGGLNAWVKILLAAGFIVWLGSGSTAVILGFTLSALLITQSQLVFLRKTIPPRSPNDPKPIAGAWPAKIWIYSWPFSTWGVFTWMQQVSDRWALGVYGGTQDVGLYAVVFQLGYTPIALVLGFSTTFLAPILYHRAGDATCVRRNRNVHQIILRMTSTALGLTGLTVLVTAVSHDTLFGILVAAGFRRGSYLLPWVILAGGLFASGQMLSLKLMSEMKSRELMAPKIVTALLGIALNILGAAVAGIEGVVAALVAFSTIYLVWMIRLARNKGAVVAEMENVGL